MGDAVWPMGVTHGPTFEAINLRIVFESGRTGFEEVKDFSAPIGTLIAGRYLVRDYLGSAAFSSALSCEDLVEDRDVCLKVIKNNKDFLDQSLDEIKLLRYINAVGDPDEHNVLRLYEYFYHKEHLFLVTELLKDNLYEFQKFLMTGKEPAFFTLPRLQRIAKQVLEALVFIHEQGLIHCDLKPENILIKSYSRCEVKVIDFGSSCYVTDHLSTYIQSRSYRAPEVILGLPYGTKIDLWSLGCIMAELWTGRVLFQNDSVQTMLARMIGVIGNFPEHMMKEGRDVAKYFNSKGVVFERTEDGDGFVLLHPKKSSLEKRLRSPDAGFVSFVSALLSLDPAVRPSAREALEHPWFKQEYEFVPYVLPNPQ